MIHLGQRIFCYLDGLTPEERENQRVKAIQDLGLLNGETIPIFEEATQTAARFLETPISILGLILPQNLLIKSAIGLSHLGLMNNISSKREIEREDSFALYVIDSPHYLVIEDTYSDSFFAHSVLAQYYGIRAYIGIPLISAENICIGVLEVMDLVPRKFAQKEIEFLNLTARWCVREYENNYLLKLKRIENTKNNVQETPNLTQNLEKYTISNRELEGQKNSKDSGNKVFQIKVDLLKEIIQELKSPLTSIIGMSSILGREIYGVLNNKQKEYIKVIRESGQNLSELIEEIISLDIFGENQTSFKIAPVDLEMFGEEIINLIEKKAIQHKQKLELTIEPGQRIWKLDKEKIRQSLYYLLISVINSAELNSITMIHFSFKFNLFNITIWNSHPWLGDSASSIEGESSLINNILSLYFAEENESKKQEFLTGNLGTIQLSSGKLFKSWNKVEQKNNLHCYQEMLTLLLSCQIIETHKGNLTIQGSEDLGYRYVLQFPQIITNH